MMNNQTNVTAMTDDSQAQNSKIPDRQRKVYGKRFAFEIRSTSNNQGQSTVSFDFAPRLNADNINWKKKIIFQLSLDELFDLCTLLAAISASVQFDFHGPNRNKSMFARWETDGNILMTCIEGKGPERKSYTVAIQSKLDRISVFNTCLYALSKELQITPAELMMQLATMNRKVAAEEVQKDKADREMRNHQNQQASPTRH